MIRSEVSELLSLIYGAERRTDAPSAVVVEAWAPLLKDVSLTEALEAAGRHYAEGAGPISISILRAGVRTLRAERLVPETIEDKYREPDADPDDTGAWVKALREKRWKPPGVPAVPPSEGLALEQVGRRVPEVSRQEVEDDAPRARRWWMKFRKDDIPPEE